MRVTSSMYYDSIYANNNSKLNKELFDVNKQIASGLKIQYAQDDVGVFTETMRLDNEITTLQQIKESAQSAYKVSNQTDSVLNEFNDSMDRIRVLLIQAANSASSDSSRDAISAELRGLEDHLRNLSNTSINGQYLFSGSATDTRPISDDGVYLGNDLSRNALLGSNVEQQYNLPGSELFLGEEVRVNREITSNVVNNSLTAKYPDFTDPTIKGVEDSPITSSSSIRDLMGDTDTIADSIDKHHFYVRGVKTDGTAFSTQIDMSDNDTISELLSSIGNAFGNTPNLDLVNVTLNSYGQIEVEDKIKGSSKLDFHMVGAVDYDQTDGNDAADINSSIYSVPGMIDNLKYGETDFDKIIKGTSTAANENLYVKTFNQSPYELTTPYTTVMKSAEFLMSGPPTAGDTFSITIDNGDGTTTPYSVVSTGDYQTLISAIEADGDFLVTVDGDTVTLNVTAQGAAKNVSIDTPLDNDNIAITTLSSVYQDAELAQNIDSAIYDRTAFSSSGSMISSNVSQIIKETNAFATPSTKISEVADLSQGTNGTLDGTQFRLTGKNVFDTPYDVQISFASAGSTFSYDSNADGVYDAGPFEIFDMGSPRAAVDADEMTYQQLMDVVNMAVTGNFPTVSGDTNAYDNAIGDSALKGETFLSYDGKLTFGELNTSNTKASISLYDVNSGDFTTPSSVMSFNSNSALTVRDAKTDFFSTIDQIITAVEEYKEYPDASQGSERSVGIQNAVKMMDDLLDHVGRNRSIVGAQSNELTNALERTELLEISTMSLRSSVVDTDLAEASLKLTQLTLNYEAMLSTVGRVSKLSLVNYL